MPLGRHVRKTRCPKGPDIPGFSPFPPGGLCQSNVAAARTLRFPHVARTAADWLGAGQDGAPPSGLARNTAPSRALGTRRRPASHVEHDTGTLHVLPCYPERQTEAVKSSGGGLGLCSQPVRILALPSACCVLGPMPSPLWCSLVKNRGSNSN